MTPVATDRRLECMNNTRTILEVGDDRQRRFSPSDSHRVIFDLAFRCSCVEQMRRLILHSSQLKQQRNMMSMFISSGEKKQKRRASYIVQFSSSIYLVSFHLSVAKIHIPIFTDQPVRNGHCVPPPPLNKGAHESQTASIHI